MKKKKIFVAGHKGMVGSSILRHLKKNEENEIHVCQKSDLNLIDQAEVDEFILNLKPDQVYIAAAKVGGIFANNNYPAEFIYENLMIQSNLIHSSFKAGTKKLLFLGSSCIYPKHSCYPMKEGELLSGKLEQTNEPYAISKIAGIKMIESYNRQYGRQFGIDYRSVMPSNLYGVGDNYHPENSHVIPGLIYRFHNATENNIKNVKVWGSGEPKREFLYVDDLASACIHVMNLDKVTYKRNIDDMQNHINVGFGSDITIRELAILIKKVTGFKGDIKFDKTKEDGTYQKLLDSSKINSLGWTPKISLEEGLKLAYDDFKRSLI